MNRNSYFHIILKLYDRVNFKDERFVFLPRIAPKIRFTLV